MAAQLWLLAGKISLWCDRYRADAPLFDLFQTVSIDKKVGELTPQAWANLFAEKGDVRRDELLGEHGFYAHYGVSTWQFCNNKKVWRETAAFDRRKGVGRPSIIVINI